MVPTTGLLTIAAVYKCLPSKPSLCRTISELPALPGVINRHIAGEMSHIVYKSAAVLRLLSPEMDLCYQNQPFSSLWSNSFCSFNSQYRKEPKKYMCRPLEVRYQTRIQTSSVSLAFLQVPIYYRAVCSCIPGSWPLRDLHVTPLLHHCSFPSSVETQMGC